MVTSVATTILIATLVYLAAGFLFALWFAFSKVDELDEEARGAPLLFRLLIIPASALLWIYLLKRILEKKKS
ncbi:MAG: hypothetical protein K1X63_14450 [Chitinophagales bacterium]|nr:hypothetical protein [Chitinophagales bacterium]